MFGKREHGTFCLEGAIEALREITAKFDMLLLVLADRNVRRAEDLLAHERIRRAHSGIPIG